MEKEDYFLVSNLDFRKGVIDYGMGTYNMEAL
jgi:hypothetical protein